MFRIFIESFSIYCEDALGSKHLLFDGEHPINNKSRLPVQTYEGQSMTITELLVSINENYASICEDGDTITPLTLNCLVASELIKTSCPVKVLELGCNDGIISYNVASLAGEFNVSSQLVCVSDTIGNESNNHWLDKIVMSKSPCNYSLMITDYDTLLLEPGIFDIVIINASYISSNLSDTINEALRMLSSHGALICLDKTSRLPFNLINDNFSESKVISINDITRIMVFNNKIATNKFSEYDSLVAKYNSIINNPASYDIATLRAFVSELNLAIDNTIKEYRIDDKLALIDIKEKIIELIIK